MAYNSSIKAIARYKVSRIYGRIIETECRTEEFGDFVFRTDGLTGHTDLTEVRQKLGRKASREHLFDDAIDDIRGSLLREILVGSEKWTDKMAYALSGGRLSEGTMHVVSTDGFEEWTRTIRGTVRVGVTENPRKMRLRYDIPPHAPFTLNVGMDEIRERAGEIAGEIVCRCPGHCFVHMDLGIFRNLRTIYRYGNMFCPPKK